MLLENLTRTLPVVLPMTLISGSIAYWRGKELADRYTVAARGLEAARKQAALVYAIFTLVLGAAASLLYSALVQATPESARTAYILISLGVGGFLSLIEAILRPRRAMKAAAAVISLYLLWTLGYGLLVPAIISGLG
jgi:hypothetical protein